MALSRKESKRRKWMIEGFVKEPGVLSGVPIGSRQLAVLMDIRDLLARMDRRLLKLEKAAAPW